jgi:hypothetical protein
LQLIGAEFAAPVGLDGLFDLTIGSCSDDQIDGTSGRGLKESLPMRGNPRTLDKTILKVLGDREVVVEVKDVLRPGHLQSNENSTVPEV